MLHIMKRNGSTAAQARAERKPAARPKRAARQTGGAQARDQLLGSLGALVRALREERRMTRRQLAPAPGVVKIRLIGEMADISRAAGLLTEAGAEVLAASGPRPNRYDPGVRVHLTIRLPGGEDR